MGKTAGASLFSRCCAEKAQAQRVGYLPQTDDRLIAAAPIIGLSLMPNGTTADPPQSEMPMQLKNAQKQGSGECCTWSGATAGWRPPRPSGRSSFQHNVRRRDSHVRARTTNRRYADIGASAGASLMPSPIMATWYFALLLARARCSSFVRWKHLSDHITRPARTRWTAVFWMSPVSSVTLNVHTAQCLIAADWSA